MDTYTRFTIKRSAEVNHVWEAKAFRAGRVTRRLLKNGATADDNLRAALRWCEGLGLPAKTEED